MTAIADTFTDYTYYIGENTDDFVYNGEPAFTYDATRPLVHQRFSAEWQTSIPYCPIDFEIVRDFDNSGVYKPLTAHETAVVSLIKKMYITTRIPSPADSVNPTTMWYTWQE